MNLAGYKKQALLLVVLFVPALLILLAIIHYGVNTPSWDDWEMVPLFQKVDHGTLTFADLWAQHNEHRILFPNIILLVSAYLTRWNVHGELLIGFLLSLVSVSLLYRMFRARLRSFGFTLLATAFLGVWFYSPIQWQNWLWEWQVEWFMCVTGVVTTIYLLDQLKQSAWKHRSWFLLAAMCTAFIATFSLGSGVLVWPAGLVMLFLQRQNVKKLVLWVASGAVSAGLYYYHYQKPAGTPPISTFMHEPIDFVRYFLVLVGKPIGGDMEANMLMGGLLLLVLVPLAYFVWLRRAQIQKFVPWISLIAFSLMTEVVTALSRLGYGVIQSTNSRYTAISLLYIIGIVGILFVILDSVKMTKRYMLGVQLLIVTIGVPLVVSSYTSGHVGVVAISVHLRQIASCTHQPRPSDKCLKLTYPNPATVRPRLEYLKAKHWAGY